MLEIANKAWDAARMFWQSLDERERGLVMYAGLYVSMNVLLVYANSHRRRQRELLAELLAEHQQTTGGNYAFTR